MKHLKFRPYFFAGIINLAMIVPNSFAAVNPEQIRILEQATDISNSNYLEQWPVLVSCISEQLINKDCATKLSLNQNEKIRAAAFNLLAQIERQANNYDQAMQLIEQALTIDPEQHLHYFQQAIINYKLLKSSKSGMQQWKYSQATTQAYRKALSLYPNEFYYRYYVTYDYLVKPKMVGGDKDKALVLAREGIELGLKEFYPVRADVYRQLKQPALALADYDLAVENNIYKTSSFVGALELAKQQGDSSRAEKYQAFIELVKSSQ